MIFFLNAINLLTVLFGFIVQVLIVRFFGASDSTDIYYLTVTITTFVTGLSTGFLTDLFVPIYHDAKARHFGEAQKLSGSLLTLSLGTGILGGAIVYLLSPAIISLFASGFASNKTIMASEMLRIVSFSIPFATISVVLNSTLNANSFLLATYLVNLVTPACNVVAIVVAGQVYGVAALMYSILFASILSFGILFLYCKLKVGARFASPFQQKDIRYLLVKNIPVRLTNMVNLLRGPLTTTALSYFPAGFLTLYSYAERIITVLLGVANSPLTQYYYVRSSEFASRKEFGEIRRLLGSVVNNSALLFAGLFFATAIVFQEAFSLLFTGRVSEEGIRTMFVVMLALFPFSYVSLVATQISTAGLAMKKGRLSLYAAIVFVVILGTVVIPSVRAFSIWGLPVSLFVAQIFSVMVYSRLLNKVERLVDPGLFKSQIDTVVIAIVVITFNALWTPKGIAQMALNSLLFAVWLTRNWGEARETLRFVTAKGEVK